MERINILWQEDKNSNSLDLCKICNFVTFDMNIPATTSIVITTSNFQCTFLPLFSQQFQEGVCWVQPTKSKLIPVKQSCSQWVRDGSHWSYVITLDAWYMYRILKYNLHCVKTEAYNLTKRKYVIVSKTQRCRFLNKVPTSVRRQDIIVEIHKFFSP